MNDKQPYNPFRDQKLHQTVSTKESELLNREGFNDVLQHADSINGHQVPKQLQDYPSPMRKWIRWGIIIYVGVFIAGVFITFADYL
ncbi:hypothetical protein SY83_19810 [Paenibacillus swuensis]|uniref:Uncharacterized protein n=1 Tax=Paenibacillus swuensis TaxID=1178515 RepID=A0A172TMP7_9BACL|nr:hypothetical protein [Paenibacillus swuensis]ANE48164.1 hypothetical protein SY83_19810 [Paenibacillus swuensis]